MNFDEKFKLLINEAEVPDCLSPDNISIMLRNKMAEKNKKPVSSAISMKSNKRAMGLRYTAAIAACVALVAGVFAFASDDSEQLPIGYINNKGEVKEAENYSDVYQVLFNSFVKNGSVYEMPDKDNKGEQVIDNTTGTETIVNDKNKNPNTITQYNVSPQAVQGVAEADILKTDGNNLYYVANNTLNVVSTDNGKMTLLSKINIDNNVPVELYIQNNKLYVISNNTVEVPYEIKKPAETTAQTSETDKTADDAASSSVKKGTKTIDATVPADTSVTNQTTATTDEKAPEETAAPEFLPPSTVLQNNVVVDVYDLSNKAAPVATSHYKQNGAYISSRMIDGVLYLVSNHSNYQTKPLESKDDLDNYIPSYYINDTKKLIDPKNIFIPSKVSSTSYTIVSGIDTNNGNKLVSIKAVIGDSDSMYCTSSNLYVIGTSNHLKDKDSTTITQFKLDKGKITYSSSVDVEGKLISPGAMGEFEQSFRIATNTSDEKNNKQYSNIYVFGSDLKPLGSLTNISEGQKMKSARFNGNSAYLVPDGDEKPVLINLSDKSKPKIDTEKNAVSYVPYLYPYSDNKMIGLGTEFDKKGKQVGMKLTMFDSKDPDNLSEISSISLKGSISEVFSDVIINRQIFFCDPDKNIFGIPTITKGEYGVKSLYYFISYEEGTGFTQKGVLEYNDINNNYDFNRGAIVNDVFYAFSNGRIVSAQLSDFKVIQTLNI